MTIVEKILARASGQKKVSPGEYVTAKIDMALMNEMIRLIQPVLAKAGIREEAFTLWDPERLVVGIDHRVPPTAVPYADHQKRSREFAKRLKIKYFYDVAGWSGPSIHG